MPTSLNDYYLYPVVPPADEWQMEDIRIANEKTAPLRVFSTLFYVIGSVGALIGGCAMGYQKIKGAPLSSFLIIAEITFLALCALGYSLQRVIGRHYQGLTREQRVKIGIDELKHTFKSLSDFPTKNEILEKLNNDEAGIDDVKHPIDATNRDICLMAMRHVLAEVRPYGDFYILPVLNHDQKQDLLDTAYSKGIILRFCEYWEFSKELPVSGEKYDKGSSGCSEKLKSAFDCSVEFLARRLPINKNDVDFINEQLKLLTVKFDDESLNSTLYLEDSETVIIRGNCSEIGDPTEAIEKLAPLVKTIKIEKEGIKYVDGLDLSDSDQWTSFQDKLNNRFPGKLDFIDQYSGVVGIWQQNAQYKRKWLALSFAKAAYYKAHLSA